MRVEDLEKKIIEAAEKHHPAYDDKAWQKMKKLLDVHMPVEKNDYCRVLWLFFLFLLLGGGIFVGITRPWKKNQLASSPSSKTVNTSSSAQKRDVQINTTNINEVKFPINEQANQFSNAGETEKQNQKTDSENVNADESQKLQKTLLIKKNKNSVLNSNQKNNKQKFIASNLKTKERNNEVVKKDESVKITENPSINNTQQQNTTILNKPVVSEEKNKNAEDDKTINENLAANGEQKNDKTAIKENPQQQTAKKQDKKQNFLSGLSFSISAGPDVSKTPNANTGKTTAVYGVGIGYAFSKFTLRTGIYSASKIYWASSKDYKLNYPLPTYVKFEGAYANCRVLEVPVSVSYHFLQRKTWLLFGSAGLSSYFMKKEKYVYWYKNTTNGSEYNYAKNYSNENKHWFSVLNLSAGYSRQLSQKFSVSAEPYLRLPLKGVGEGKVKLNSGGILFSIGYKPFLKK
ncbi:MAG: hypothetical protein C4308_04410 [Chitinophagaceae bacterium]